MPVEVKRRRPQARPPRRPVNDLQILQRVRHDPVDLDLLTAALAIELVLQPMDPRCCLTLVPTERPDLSGMNWTLTVNADHDEVRRRFSIAHAIGHTVMHADLIGDGLNDDLDYRCVAGGAHANARIREDHETSANRIAVGVLLPVDAVRRRHAEFPDLTSLAGHFRVNARMMRIRLENLDLPVPPRHALLAGGR